MFIKTTIQAVSDVLTAMFFFERVPINRFVFWNDFYTFEFFVLRDLNFWLTHRQQMISSSGHSSKSNEKKNVPKLVSFFPF